MLNVFGLNQKIIEEIHEKYLNSLQKKSEENSILFQDGNEDFNEISELLSSLTTKSLARIVEVTFSKSLEQEEGRFHDFSIKIVPNLSLLESSTNWFVLDSLKELYVFKNPIPLEDLPKLAPALQNPKQEMFVWLSRNGQPEIWAFGKRHFDNLSIIINVSLPGKLLIVTPLALSEMTSANNVFLLNFSKATFIDRSSNFRHIFLNTFYDEYLKSVSENRLENKKSFFKINNFQKTIEKIILKMKQHTHGGTLLIIKNESLLFHSIQEQIPFAPKSKYKSIGENIFYENYFYWEIDSSIEEKLSLLGQLTAVDGATIITQEFELIAFGAKIKPINVDSKPHVVKVSKPFKTDTNDKNEDKIELANLGGTRHQSAAQFVYDQRDSFAVVASQDGKISVMYWDKEIEQVRVIQHADYLFV